VGIDPDAFIAASTTLLTRFGSAVGTPESLTACCAARQARHLRGMRAARELYDRRAARGHPQLAARGLDSREYGSLERSRQERT